MHVNMSKKFLYRFYRYEDTNPVPSSSLSDDVATVPSVLVRRGRGEVNFPINLCRIYFKQAILMYTQYHRVTFICLQDLDEKLTDEEKHCIMDLRPYMNRTPYTVAPVSRNS